MHDTRGILTDVLEDHPEFREVGAGWWGRGVDTEEGASLTADFPPERGESGVGRSQRMRELEYFRPSACCRELGQCVRAGGLDLASSLVVLQRECFRSLSLLSHEFQQDLGQFEKVPVSAQQN